MTKHTKTPWRYQLGDHKHDCHGQIFDADGNLLVLRAVVNNEDAKIMLLIADAPAMLEALAGMLARFADHEQYDETGEDTAAIEAARALIAKHREPNQ